MKLIIAILIIIHLCQARQGFGPGDQDWGYVEVRPHAHMFWWLHRTTADEDRPLLIWLQGGPAASSTGEGNILMSGPIDMDLNPRNHSFVHKANVLYVDNPVGAGYSYVDVAKGGKFVSNTEDAAVDFVEMLKGFMQLHPEFQQAHLYILGESYGGKYAPAYAKYLLQAVESGEILANVRGIGMAYPAMDSLESVGYIPETLYQTGIVDNHGREELQFMTDEIFAEAAKENWEDASLKTDALILHVQQAYNLSYGDYTNNNNEFNFDKLNRFMDDEVSPVLNLTWKFSSQRQQAYDAIKDIVKSGMPYVQHILDFTLAKVAIYTGQLDWLINSLGVYSSVYKMEFRESGDWLAAKREPFYIEGVHEGHVKEYRALSFYWVKRAGHRLPNDNPGATNYVLRKLIGY